LEAPLWRNEASQLGPAGREIDKGYAPHVPDEVSHPLFARFFDRFSPAMEREVGPLRDEMLEGLSGRVLEVGAGNGINFAHYPSTVKAVVAIEPEPYFRGKAEQAAATAPVPVSVRAGLAGELDLEAGSFDAAVCSLVLCSVPDQAAALQELHRALRRGGELRFLEHVRGEGVKANVQRAVDSARLWPAMVGGCHCSRDTVAALHAAGFELRKVRTLSVGPSWMFTNPHVLGVAIR
jgi:SAM-dependent methyltransferase